MTPQEKAKELALKFHEDDLLFDTLSWNEAKQCALIAVDEIKTALEDYGKSTMELQNMEREFAWWDSVENEINKL